MHAARASLFGWWSILGKDVPRKGHISSAGKERDATEYHPGGVVLGRKVVMESCTEPRLKGEESQRRQFQQSSEEHERLHEG